MDILSMLFGALRSLFAVRNLWRPDIEGHWYLETHTSTSDFNPYKGLRLQYQAQIFVDGSGGVKGSAEKCRELRADGTSHFFRHEVRPTSELQGALHWRFGWRLTIYSLDTGHQRQTRATYLLKFDRAKDQWKGSFSTTAGNCRGTARWKRDDFLNC
jgi:hypothetical protein